MRIKHTKKSILNKTTIAILCLAAILCTAGCSKITTSDAPPTKIEDCTYNDALHYFSKETDGQVQFFSTENGKPTETKIYTFDKTMTHNGLNYKVTFAYSKVNGNFVFQDLKDENSNSYFLKACEDQNNGLFICLNTVNNGFHPYLYDTKSNTIKDIFEGTGYDDVFVEDFKMNSNFKKSLLFCKSPDKVYLCDITEKSLSDMTILTGIENISNAIWTKSNDIILLENDGNDNLKTWYFNTTNGKCKLTSDNYRAYNKETGAGLIIFENQYGVNITEKGELQIIDLSKGTSKKVKKITVDENSIIDTKAHTKGKLILIATSNHAGNKTVSMINLEQGKIIKQREISSENTQISFYNTNYIIAYSEEGNYEMYYMGEAE